MFTNRKIFILMFTNRKIFDKLQDKIENYLSKEQKMRVNRNKLKIAMAKACMNTSDLQKASEMHLRS